MIPLLKACQFPVPLGVKFRLLNLTCKATCSPAPCLNIQLHPLPFLPRVLHSVTPSCCPQPGSSDTPQNFPCRPGPAVHPHQPYPSSGPKSLTSSCSPRVSKLRGPFWEAFLHCQVSQVPLLCVLLASSLASVTALTVHHSSLLIITCPQTERCQEARTLSLLCMNSL